MAEILRSTIRVINKNIEVAIAFTIVAIIGIIIIPMPGPVLDFFLVINISLGVVILLLTLFTRNVLEFSTFPTLLLITTMFRLGLNISSTRLILSRGDAGKVIDSFAVFVTGNNYIVGAIIFIIIIIVQMVVVTNGAGRVSEVSARFTLDAMPGKQMAIDADLNTGVIDENEARKRRTDLQREADFYGAMDGASKFVKGDAIAGIIITIINLLGGILLFSITKGMGALEALDKFGKLTIGDGLVNQIPALLISIASGILVTRSDDEHGFGESVTGELLGYYKVIMIGASIVILIGMVPAFPTIPFLIVGLVLGVISYLLMENEKQELAAVKDKESMAPTSIHEKDIGDGIIDFQVEPISLEIGYSIIPLVDESNDDNLIVHISSIRRQCANEMGIIVNPIRIRDNLQLDSNEYLIKIKGNELSKGEIYLNKYLLIDPGMEELSIEGIPTKEPAFGLDALWVSQEVKDEMDLKGYTIVDPAVVLVTHLKEVIKKYSHLLLGRQEVKQLLEGIKGRYNVVIEELIPDVLTLGEVQKVLQNLLKEKIPINDLVTILEVLADNGVRTKDTEMLTEYVRNALGRTIVKEYVNAEGVLTVATIHPELEELIGSNIQKTVSGSVPVLKPDIITKILDGINEINKKLLLKGVQPVILVSPKIRAAFKNLISFNFPNLLVLSLNDVPHDIEIEAIGMVDKV